ncbi:MAG TPA: class II aldolase/adducin family protein [Chloroflexota bacterium]
MNEDAAREQLATCTRIFAMHGLLGMFGHISVYLPETRRVVICPGSGAEKATAQAEDMLVIDLAGTVLDGSWTIPREWPIHTELHQARPDARAVAHCHAHESTLFAIAQRELRPVTMSGAIFAAGVPVYERVEFIDTLAAGRRVVAAIGERPALLLRCHGTVSVGSGIEAMLHTAFILEDNARKLLDAQPLGPIEPLTREECLALEAGYPEARARAHWAYLAADERRWDRQRATGVLHGV